MRFESKAVIITGAGSGIGRACSLQFAQEGASVVIADINEDHGHRTVSEIQSKGGESEFVRCDVSRPEDLQNLVDQTLKKFGRLDIIVNNAAVMTFAPLVQVRLEDWERVIHTNLRSVFLLCKFGLPHIHGGAIVNVSSVHAHETTANNSPYASSKGGIEALTRALSREVTPDICRVNSVAPGAVDTPMLWNNPNVKSGKEKVKGAIGKAEDLAEVICFLASQDARFIHGSTVVADGGRLDIL